MISKSSQISGPSLKSPNDLEFLDSGYILVLEKSCLSLRNSHNISQKDPKFDKSKSQI